MDFLKRYKIVVESLAPVFIGSGERISKKEYVFHKYHKKVLIPDLFKLYKGLEELNLIKEYEKYLLYDGRDLFAWFKANKLDKKDYQEWMKYSLDSGDAVFEDRGKKEILLFIKDAYGYPYIPGSSLKGALRTALLTENILKNKNSYNNSKIDIVQAKYTGRRYLGKEAATIEQQTFNTLKRSNKWFDAVNDCLAGVHISDSKPMSLSDLVLCQKIDVTVDGKQKSLPILRECIKPQRKIEFNLTIDTHLCNYTVDRIISSINSFFECHKNVFNKAFGKDQVYPENSFYLGGGSGYVSKTLTYPLFGKEEGVELASRIIDNTLPFKAKKEHKHYKDVSLGVSPHMLKCTKYKGTLYEMGLCKINITENK